MSNLNQSKFQILYSIKVGSINYSNKRAILLAKKLTKQKKTQVLFIKSCCNTKNIVYGFIYSKKLNLCQTKN